MKSEEEVEVFREKLDNIRMRIEQGDIRGFAGQTYEEGMDHVIRWLLEEEEERPLAEYPA